MRPQDFWALHPVEFWWLMEAQRPVKMYGSLPEHEIAALYDEMVDEGML